MFQIKVVAKIKTCILRSIMFSENRAVYEIMSKKCGGTREVIGNNYSTHALHVGEVSVHARPLTHARMHARIHTEICTIAFPQQQFFSRTRLNVTLYVRCVSCSEFLTKHVNTLCGQKMEFFNVKPGGTDGNHYALKVPVAFIYVNCGTSYLYHVTFLREYSLVGCNLLE